MQDIEIECIECGKKFVFSINEQFFYEKKGFIHPPKRCKKCRNARKKTA